MSSVTEFDYYIPPDVAINTDGTIVSSDFNKVYQFNDGDNLHLLSFTGMGMPPINYITQRGPFQHGITALDFRLNPRVIQFVHRRNACARQEYWDTARATIINAMRPNRQFANCFEPGRLRKIQPDGTTRDIFAHIEFGPVFSARSQESWDEWSISETIRFICHDPTWFDPALQTVEWDVDVFGGLIFWESPDWADHLTFPIVFSGDAIQAFQSVTYAGTWQSFPEIVFTGPLNNPQVENTTTGEKIKLNYNIALGETVTISLVFGNKTAISSTGQNVIGTVTSDSDLATFHIAPDPEATGGVNTFSASGENGQIDVTKITLNYNTRYIGI